MIPSGVVIAEFNQYPDAVSYVDRLIKNDFPPQAVSIVGSDLRTVERVRLRLSNARVALSGASTGAWLGLIVGLLFSSPDATNGSISFGPLGSAILIGAGIGMLFNIGRFGFNRRRRQFLSGSSVVASRYEVLVPAESVEQARTAAAKPEED